MKAFKHFAHPCWIFCSKEDELNRSIRFQWRETQVNDLKPRTFKPNSHFSSAILSCNVAWRNNVQFNPTFVALAKSQPTSRLLWSFIRIQAATPSCLCRNNAHVLRRSMVSKLLADSSIGGHKKGFLKEFSNEMYRDAFQSFERAWERFQNKRKF